MGDASSSACPVSYSIGTTLSWGPSGKFDPSSEYFVYECDEFDRNFLHFTPFLSLITSIEHDHPDTYPTEESYFEAFSQFADQSKHVIGWKHDLHALGFASSSWRLADDEVLPHARYLAFITAKTPRLSQRRSSESSETANIPRSIDSFPGTARRFEKLARQSLQRLRPYALRNYSNASDGTTNLSDHVVLVYQPHQNVRQYEIREQYTDEVFTDAERIYWLPTYLIRERSRSKRSIARGADGASQKIATTHRRNR